MSESESTSSTPATPAEGTPSDYIALTSFDALPLSAETRAALVVKGYTRPTPVQAAALRPILAGRDVLVRSKTGTGKTAAFGIPIVELIDPAVHAVQALVLCNTRELALQVATEIGEIGNGKGVKVAAIYGGSSMDAQLRALKEGATVVVATPGRLIDLLERKTLSLENAKIAVLDEADEMLGVGFLEDVTKILKKLPRVHQTLLFSATLSPDIERLIQTHLREPETILLSGDVYTVEGISHIRYFAQDSYPKPRNLLYMLQLENPETAIIFCNTRDDVNLISTVLNRHGLDADRLSGEMAQSERERVMAKVKRGEVRFMVATDLAARGIDISDLTHVINYSLPEDASVYLHRVGRTGRIGKTGTAISLVRGTELTTLTTLEKKFGIKFIEKQMPTPDEAHKLWVDSHLTELRDAIGSQIFDAYLSLAADLRTRDGGEALIAFALKYFFVHHRMERLSALHPGEESRQKEVQQEVKGRLQERRAERSKPKMDAHERPKPAERRPAPAPDASATPEAPRESRPRPTRLFVRVGTSSGLDIEGIKAGLLALSGATAESIRRLDVKAEHSHLEVVPESAAAFLAASGKAYQEKPFVIEPARRR